MDHGFTRWCFHLAAVAMVPSFVTAQAEAGAKVPSPLTTPHNDIHHDARLPGHGFHLHGRAGSRHHHPPPKRQLRDLEPAGDVPLKITNLCPGTIWPAIFTAEGIGPGTGGFELLQENTVDLYVSSTWNGRIWGRTNCSFIEDGTRPSNLNGGMACSTGDCGGVLNCGTAVSSQRLCFLNIRSSFCKFSRRCWLCGLPCFFFLGFFFLRPIFCH